MNPLISIIVPVYNAESTLDKCVDSIINQTFTNWELLLINDGSKDYSGKICDEYAAKDPRIKVFHKKNGGVSSARNIGLDNAQGEWIAFCDSDDWISFDFLDVFISYDLSLCDFYISGVQLIGSDFQILPPDICLDLDNVALLDDILNKIYFTAPWGKLYKKQIIEDGGIRFNEKLKIGEDTDFILNYLLYIDKIRLISRPLYHFFNDESCKISKYALSASAYITHVSCIRKAFVALGNKVNYKFPVTYPLLMRYYSHLFYVHLMCIQSYPEFKREVCIYKKAKVPFYPKSRVNNLMMQLIRIVPYVVFVLFRLIVKRKS